MARKAGIWVVAAAAVGGAAAVVATAVFGAGSGPATVKRPGALHLRARIEAPVTARAAGANTKPKPVLYGATKPQGVPIGDSSVTVGGCPRGYHITNGTVGALHGSQAPNFTIRGSGPVANQRGLVKKWFIDLNNSNTTTPIAGVGFIVCQR